MSVSLSTAYLSDMQARPKRQMTKKDWQQRKAYITICYIKEKKPFSYIRDRLMSEGFLVSRRTFTKKISEWGLKKNCSKKEREEIVKSRRNIEGINSDHRVTEAKIQRWQKQFGDSKISELPSLVSSQNCLQNTYMYTKEDLNCVSEVEAPLAKRHRQEGSSFVLHQEFPENASGNVVDLAQLLSRLGVCVSPAVGKDKDFLAREEPLAETSSDGRALTESQYHCTRTKGSFLHTTNTKANIFFNIEIGIFSGSRRHAPRLSWTEYSFQLKEVWPREAKQLRAKLYSSPAEEVFPTTQKVSVLQQLARLYFDLGWLDNSLEMQQQIFAATKSQPLLNPHELLITCLEISYLYHLRNDFRTAAKLHSAVHPQIIKFLCPEHPIRLFSSYLYARILYHQSQYSEGEKVIRTVVQITYGWNNQFFTKALQLLGWFMKETRSASLEDIANSHRFLIKNFGGGDFIVHYDSWFYNAQDLLEVLTRQGDYTSCDMLCAYIIERVELVCGHEDLDYLAAQRVRAIIWSHQGRLSESYTMLCKVLNGFNAIGGYEKYPPFQRDLFYNLGLVEEKMGKDSDALMSYMRCLEVEIRLWGLQHEEALDTCEYIGDCYSRLGRYNDALNFYGKVVERLRNIPDNGYPAIERVMRLSTWTWERMEEACKRSSIVQDNDEVEDMDCDQGKNSESFDNAGNQEMVEDMDRDINRDDDMSRNTGNNMAHDISQVDILEDFDWDTFFDYPTPLI